MDTIKKLGHHVINQGQAGVHMVAAQLLLRGHVPLFPDIDYGFDIMLENGLRLQVKAARLTYPKCGIRTGDSVGVRGGGSGGNYLGGAYGFCVRRGGWLTAEKRWQTKAKKGYADVADFFVLWGIDENRFWIVPTSIKNRVIWFGRKDHPNASNNSSHTSAIKAKRIAEMEDRWDLLDLNACVDNVLESSAPSLATKERP